MTRYPWQYLPNQRWLLLLLRNSDSDSDHYAKPVLELRKMAKQQRQRTGHLGDLYKSVPPPQHACVIGKSGKWLSAHMFMLRPPASSKPS